jgi:3-hydroxy-9,10-secoandrosta-1,3,5(10)-triene-9,17-dione monooxygenase
VRVLCTVNGASSFDEISPLQRIWRDLEIASRHPGLNLETASEVYRRALVGVPDGQRPAL